MATAIKAIPTLHVEDAIRFREEMEANERAFLSRTKRDRNRVYPCFHHHHHDAAHLQYF